MHILDGKIERNEHNQNSNGGSELITEALVKNVDPSLLQDVQIVVSRLTTDLRNDKFRVYHCHDLPQDAPFLANGGWQKFHKLVFVSNWQKQLFISTFDIPWSRCTVLRNAIDPVVAHPQKNTDEINLVYHTTPHRGLDILVESFKELITVHDNINLHVYSSFSVYGWDDHDKQFEPIFENIEKTERAFRHDPLPNDQMKSRLTGMDIFAYPSTHPETSCISLIEALSAGLVCVHSDFGALSETAGHWTYMYDFNENKQHHFEAFTGMLDSTIKIIKERPETLVKRLSSQQAHTNLYYSWDLRKLEWENFLTSLKQMPLKLETDEVPIEGFSYSSGG